jgi:hypothetical protein
MSIVPPIAESSKDLVSSEHPQLLIVCLLMGLMFCGGIVLYTNQMKGKASSLAQDSYSGGYAADITPSSEIVASSPVLGTGSMEQPRPSDAFVEGKLNKQSGKPYDAQTLAHGGPYDALSLAHDRRDRNELVSQKVTVSKPGPRKVLPTPTARGSASLSRSRPRNSLPGHVRTTLIALWRQSLKRHQNDKLSHLTPNPST